MTYLHDYPFGVAYDGLCTLLGERLGNGRDREVWTCPIDDGLVVKVEMGTASRQNYAEWLLWSTVVDAETSGHGRVRTRFRRIREWLCPVVKLSDYGSFLVMKRTTTPLESDFPAKVPTFLYDLKRANFGMLDGRLVCHDYGIIAGVLVNNMLAGSSPDLREKAAKWWNE